MSRLLLLSLVFLFLPFVSLLIWTTCIIFPSHSSGPLLFIVIKSKYCLTRLWKYDGEFTYPCGILDSMSLRVQIKPTKNKVRKLSKMNTSFHYIPYHVLVNGIKFSVSHWIMINPGEVGGTPLPFLSLKKNFICESVRFETINPL